MKMLSFFSSHALKEAVRGRVARHQRLDQIVQGTYTRTAPDGDGRVIAGCFIGCSLHSGNHDEFPRLLGLPEWYGRIGERIFEGLPRGEHLTFPLEVYEATPVGVDLDPVRDRFLVWCLTETLPHAGKSRPAVEHVIELMRRRLAGNEPSSEEWATARDAEAASWAADAAAESARAAGAATWAAARAATWAAAESAWVAEAAVAAEAARADFYRRARVEFVRLLREIGPVVASPEALPETPEFERYYAAVRAEEASK
jgi:hypothetical protein